MLVLMQVLTFARVIMEDVSRGVLRSFSMLSVAASQDTDLEMMDTLVVVS